MDPLHFGGTVALASELAVAPGSMEQLDEPAEPSELDAPITEPAIAHGNTGISINIPLWGNVSITSPSVLFSIYAASLIFIGALVFILKPAEVMPVTVQGIVQASRPSEVTIKVGKMWQIDNPHDDGTVDDTFYPDLEKIRVEVIVPDRQNQYPTAKRINNSNVLDFGKIIIGEVPKPPEGDKQVTNPPVKLTPLKDAGTFR